MVLSQEKIVRIGYNEEIRILLVGYLQTSNDRKVRTVE